MPVDLTSKWRIPNRCGDPIDVARMSGVMSQPSAALNARVTFEVGYVEAGGVERRVPLGPPGRVAPEHGRLVRSFPSYKGQRNFPGPEIGRAHV